MQVDEKYVNEIIKNFEREAGKEYAIVAIGSGGSMPFDVETIGVRFVADRRATIEDARRLIIALKEKLASAVNQNEKLRPYLREYPFSPLRSDISISFCQKDGKPYLDGGVSFVSVGKGDRIYYHTENSSTHKDEYLLQEPYEEAVKIVKTKGDKICLDLMLKEGALKSDASSSENWNPNPKDGLVYISELIEAFKEIAKNEFNLEVLSGQASAPVDIEKFIFRFNVHKKCSLEEARELLVNLKERLVMTVNQNEKIRPFLNNYPILPVGTHIDLYFEKSNDSVYYIFDKQKGIQYFSENPQTQKSEKIYEETFAEAVKIIKAKQSNVCNK